MAVNRAVTDRGDYRPILRAASGAVATAPIGLAPGIAVRSAALASQGFSAMRLGIAIRGQPPTPLPVDDSRLLPPSSAPDLPQAPPVAAESVPSVAGPSGKFYSVAFETKLNPTSYPGVSRGAHFQEANGSLLRAMEGNAAFAQDMQSLGINLQRTPTDLAPRTSPSGWTWHHAEEPGVMQLVPKSQHQPGSIFQGALHPNGKGGYSIWGKE